MEILIKLTVDILCGLCKWISERWWHNAQRFIMPLLLVGSISYETHIWWMGLPTIGIIAVILQGYGLNSWLGKELNLAGAQGMWMFLICVIAGIVPALFGHLPWQIYIPWCILGGVVGGLTHNADNNLWSWVKGLLIGSVVWFVK